MLTGLTVLNWDWDLIVIRIFDIGIHCSDVGLGFRFWDLAFDFQRFEILE